MNWNAGCRWIVSTPIVRIWCLVSCLIITAGGMPSGRGERCVQPSLPAEVAIKNSLPKNRRAADVAAKEKFLNLHFFANGRGVHIAPGLIDAYNATAKTGIYDGLIANRWGMNVLPGHRIAGLFDVHYKDMRVGVTGCAVCHSGKAAGRFIVGLGNKRFDITRIGKDLRGMEKIRAAFSFSSGERREVEISAIHFAERVADDQIGNLTQGLVPVSFVWSWFYRIADEPLPPGFPRGAVKIPALWGYGEKRRVGMFCDSSGDGHLPGWIFGVELAAGQTPETVRTLLPESEKTQELFAAFLPPAYPFSIARVSARQGERIFARNCRECHGMYARDEAGLPRFKRPRWVPETVVGTDADRLDLSNGAFPSIAARNPLHDVIRHHPRHRGYFAPRLEGIWCRFPFLHNASVPNIAALLTPPEERPRVFSLKDAGERDRFDEALLGLTPPSDREQKRLLQRGAKGERSVYDTRRAGHSNAGHDFGTELSRAEKESLIEYLKTL